MPGKGQDRFWLRNSRHLGFGREPSLEQLMRMADLVRSLAHLSQRELLFEHKAVNGIHSASVTFTGLSSKPKPVESAISKEHAFALACYKLLKAICSNHSVLSPKILLQTVAYAKSMEEVAVRMLPAFDLFMRTIGDAKISGSQKQQVGLKLAQSKADKAVSQYIEEERRCSDEPLSEISLEGSSSDEKDLIRTTACSSKKKKKKSKDTSSSSENEPEKKPSVVKTELTSSESIDGAARPCRAVCTSRRKIKIEVQSPPPSPLSEKTPEISTAAMSTMTEVASAAASNEEVSVKSTKKRKKKKSLPHHSDEFEHQPMKKIKAEPFSPLPEFGDEAATTDQVISNRKEKEDAAATSTSPLSSFTYSPAEHTREEEQALFANAVASQERWANYVRILHEKILPAKIASELPADIVSRVSCWMDGANPRVYAVQLQRRAVKKCKEDDNRDPFVEFFEAAKKSFKNFFPDSFFELLLSLDNWDSISAVLENHGRKLAIDFRDNQMEKLRIGRARLLCRYDELFLTPEIAAIVNSIAADPGTFEPFDLSSPAAASFSTKPHHRPVELSDGKAPFDDESRWRVVLTHGVISAWWREGEAADWEKEHAEEMESFSALIHVHFLNNVQGQPEYEQKLEVLKLITDAAKMVLDNFGVHFRITGSTTSLLSSFNSDLNLCLVHPTDVLDIDFARRIYPELVEVLGNRFEVTSKSLSNLHNLAFTARLADSSLLIPVVISHNIHCVHYSQLMALYERVDDRLAPLCLFIKHWLLQTKHSNGSLLSINSYLMTSLLIHFLQCGVSPPVLPCLHELYPMKLANDKILELGPMAPFDPPLPARENDQSLSTLLLGFFDYFSVFRFDEFFVSIRAGRPIRLSNNKLSLPPRRCEIVVEDPFDQCLKITSVGVVPLQRKMMEAAKEIRSSFNLSNVQV